MMVLMTMGLFAGVANAEVRRLEVVGAVSLDAQTRRSGVPKDMAIEEALWEGVSRVADQLLVDSVVEEPEDGSNPIRTALGTDMVPYTRGFRILEDRGERPSLFRDDPNSATEYVVVVEVQVDAERVRDRLVAAGLLELVTGASDLTRIRVEVRGLARFGGYEELVALILDDRVGASSVTPLVFERGRAVLRVEAEWGASVLLARLLEAAPPRLEITPEQVTGQAQGRRTVGADGKPAPESLVLEVTWTPPPRPDPDAPKDRSASRR